MSMTAVVARSPLHHLSMNGTQGNGNKRKSTRLLLDEDNNAPPTKKARGDVPIKSASAHAPNGAKSAGTRPTTNVRTRATRKAYEEEDNGFTFSRRQSKRTTAVVPPQSQPQSQPPASIPVPAIQEQTDQAPQDDAPPAPATTAPVQKKRPRKTLPVSPEHSKTQQHIVRRRSKRLSRDDQEVVQHPPLKETTPNVLPEPTQPVSTPKQVNAPPEREQSPQPGNGPDEQELHVEKQRRLTKIPLPLADTPVIRRNKEMRKHSAEQSSRRSSSGMRGKRASSLIDAGTSHGDDLNVKAVTKVEGQAGHDALPDIAQAGLELLVTDHVTSLEDKTADNLIFLETAVPHAEVETQELYKHISQDLIEPKRMRQLLVWCGNRALPQKAGGQMEADETAARHAARVIQEELLNEFGSKSELSSWFDREDTTPAVTIKKANPRNINNAEKLQELEAELSRLQAEKKSWDDLISATSGRTDKEAGTEATPSANMDPSDIDPSLLDSSQAEILNALLSKATLNQQAAKPEPGAQTHTMSDSAVPTTQQRIEAVAQTLEFKIDQFADSAHRMEQYRQMADRAADKVLATGAQQLETRDLKLRERHAGNTDPIDTLRSLSRVLHGKGKGRSA